ncbi:MAG: response regulator [Betaproteobacteria bacterium]
MSILIVDDEFDARSVIELIFELEGYEVVSAANGEAALDQIAVRKPDVILTDWMMPIMDGPEFCRRVRANPDTRNIPIIMLTGAPPTLHVAEKAWDATFIKPPDYDRLLRLVRKLTAEP